MTTPRRTKVLIIEDSPVVQELLCHIVGQDPRLEVAGVAASGEQALHMLDRIHADVVSLDIRLPGMDGFQVTQQIMRHRPTPIVVVASASTDAAMPMKALQAGALAVVEKPGSLSRGDYQALSRHLCTQLYSMSQVKVIRQRIARSERGTPARGAVRTPAGTPPPPVPVAAPTQRVYRALGIATSTGGPNALVKLLGGLAALPPLPILLVQHIGAPFVAGFASWLGSVCPFPVVVAENGAFPMPGTIHMAPGDRHLSLTPAGRIVLTDDPPQSGQRPSGDVMFEAMAIAYGPGGLGVVLTGMGEDGARGLLAMRRAGAYTIAEHASTAVIHGMPGAAVRLGAALEELPLDDIAARLLHLVQNPTESP